MDRINTFLRRLPTGVVWALGLVPMALLFWGAVNGSLGADPVKALELGLGEWGLRLLIGSLAITPLMRLGLRLVKFRRAIGVTAFFYVALHFAVWLALDMGLRWGQITQDLWKRPYILIGFAAFLLLLPLAVTSTNGWLRRLGAAGWRRLHRLAYPAILLGAVHFVMIGKVWTAESLIHLGLVLGLLGLRLLPGHENRARLRPSTPV
jgi:methionine sulfoxide reductase heme-binding subunit